jgi:type IV secretory pathway ATPase VirB11/archaellum biosynthesis ATPase
MEDVKIQASQEELDSLPKDEAELDALSYSKRAKAAEKIGEIVGKTVNEAVNVCNEFLKAYGFRVSVNLNFHKIEEESTETLLE